MHTLWVVFPPKKICFRSEYLNAKEYNRIIHVQPSKALKMKLENGNKYMRALHCGCITNPLDHRQNQ